jgi:hypothetical protein
MEWKFSADDGSAIGNPLIIRSETLRPQRLHNWAL